MSCVSKNVIASSKLLEATVFTQVFMHDRLMLQLHGGMVTSYIYSCPSNLVHSEMLQTYHCNFVNDWLTIGQLNIIIES